jgi:hypothetical protein
MFDSNILVFIVASNKARVEIKPLSVLSTLCRKPKREIFRSSAGEILTPAKKTKRIIL